MDLYLKIADYNILLTTQDEKLHIFLNPAYHPFLNEKPEKTDLKINISYGIPDHVLSAKNVLTPGLKIGVDSLPSDITWNVLKKKGSVYLLCNYSNNPSSPDTVAEVKKDFNWNIYVKKDFLLNNAFDPMMYPQGSLILYYLTALKGDVLIHASGVFDTVKGRIFTGVSGIGKTTMAKIWKQSGAKVISDDRLIIRTINGNHYMFNTPLRINDIPKKAPLDEIYLLKQSPENTMKRLNGASSVSRIMAHCIQQDYDEKLIHNLLDRLSNICNTLPVYELGFSPDSNVISFIKQNEFTE
ncbi:MAG: hypothetical protein HY958_01310 [Bacteroidia bacterium]|nr:hypothetical protein [Bacteroidia bacterium]